MIHFFYGPDAYSLAAELRKLKARFSLVEELDFELDAGRLRDVLESRDLFAEKKLVILRGFLGEAEKAAALGAAVDLVFVESEPDRRTRGFKFLQKHAAAKEFAVPEGAALRTWIKDYAFTGGFQIEPAAAAELASRLGAAAGSLRQYANELDKLMLYKAGAAAPVLTAADAAALVPRNFEEDIFALTDHFAARQAGSAAAVLERLMGREGAAADGKSQAIQILGALAAQIRSFLLMKSFHGAAAAEIAAALGWKEARVWINQKLAARFDEPRLAAMLRDLLAIDRRLKTSEEPPKLLLTLFIQKATA